MPDLSAWLTDQETRFAPYFSTLGCPGAKEQVIALLVLHAATCHENFRTGPDFLEGILGMYRINRGSAFTLPVDGWAKIRRAEQVGMAEELCVDICGSAYLREPLQPIPEELVVESLRGLVQAAPVVESLSASDAIADWCGTDTDKAPTVTNPDVNALTDLQLAIDADDHGITGLVSFWAIERAYAGFSLGVEDRIRQEAGEQLLLFDDKQNSPCVQVDLPTRILSNHLRVVERAPEGAYFARARLYLACLEWYRRKMMHPTLMGHVAAAVTCAPPVHSVAEAR